MNPPAALARLMATRYTVAILRGLWALEVGGVKTVRVLDVGNCDPDHGAIRAMLTGNFEVQVERVMHVSEALAALGASRYALVLVNRRIFADDSDGLELVRAMRADENLRTTPVMMISNHSEAQARATAAGAVKGFGKAALRSATTLDRLAQYLPRTHAAATAAGARE